MYNIDGHPLNAHTDYYEVERKKFIEDCEKRARSPLLYDPTFIYIPSHQTRINWDKYRKQITGEIPNRRRYL